MARKLPQPKNQSSNMSITVGYEAFGLDHLLRNIAEVQKDRQRITEANIDEILNDGSISTQKISKVA